MKDRSLSPAIHSELELYAKAGGAVIFAQVESENSFEIDPGVSLANWGRKADGTMEFDYTGFDKWVELNFEHGIDGIVSRSRLLALLYQLL